MYRIYAQWGFSARITHLSTPNNIIMLHSCQTFTDTIPEWIRFNTDNIRFVVAYKLYMKYPYKITAFQDGSVIRGNKGTPGNNRITLVIKPVVETVLTGTLYDMIEDHWRCLFVTKEGKLCRDILVATIVYLQVAHH